MDYSSYKFLRVEQRGSGILLLTMNRPDVLNACDSAGHHELGQIWLDFDNDPSAKVAIITGEGKLDNQTLEGKTPAGVANLGRKFCKQVFAIVGRAEANSKARDLFARVYELAGPIPEAKELLRERARELATALKGVDAVRG